MIISGVYKIVSLSKPDRCYIGSSQDIHKRWSYHIRELRKDKHHSQKLQRHYNKYGKNDLTFSILIGCDKSDLITTEQYFIDIYKPYFNGMAKAGNNGGFSHTEEARKKIGNAMRGKNNPNFGKKFSAETCKKISEARKGKANNKGCKWSEESKKKLSEAKKGISVSPDTQFKKGHVSSAETREKVSEALKGRVPWNKGNPYPHKGYTPSEETREKKRIASIGKKHTEETKKKMSEWRKKYYANKKLQLLDFEINNN